MFDPFRNIAGIGNGFTICRTSVDASSDQLSALA
jgi:hypothetical protein